MSTKAVFFLNSDGTAFRQPPPLRGCASERTSKLAYNVPAVTADQEDYPQVKPS